MLMLMQRLLCVNGNRATWSTVLRGGVLLLSLLIGLSSLAHAQTGCNCPENLDTTQTITICINGVDRNVAVTHCSQRFCPPQLATECNDIPQVAIHQRTIIKRICPIGFTATAQQLRDGVIAAMGLCCGNKAGFVLCPPVSGGWCWLVSIPSCMYFSADGCLVACDNSPCCTLNVRYTPNNPMPGQCSVEVLQTCTTSDECPVGCTDLGCDIPAECCIR
jgi:hypothetical protein